eukprot:s522_g16.t1
MFKIHTCWEVAASVWLCAESAHHLFQFHLQLQHNLHLHLHRARKSWWHQAPTDPVSGERDEGDLQEELPAEDTTSNTPDEKLLVPEGIAPRTMAAKVMARDSRLATTSVRSTSLGARHVISLAGIEQLLSNAAAFQCEQPRLNWLMKKVQRACLQLEATKSELSVLHVFTLQLGLVRIAKLGCSSLPGLVPTLTPLDPMVTPKERPAVVRFWWYYTLHRVLAKRSGQRRMPLKFLDLVLKAGYRFKYRSMLTAVVGRSGPLIPGSRELQMHLAYPDIVSCYRAVLAKAVGQGSYAIRAAQQAEAEVVDAVEVEELEALTEEEEEMVEIDSADSADVADSADSSDEEDPSGSGTWELRWSGLEAGKKAEGQIESRKSFSFSSPESGKIYAAAKDVVKINQLVSMTPRMFNSVFQLGPKDWACIGEQFALIVQARAISGKEVHAVVHCPDCKVMLWEPLILTLRAFFNEHSKEDAKTLSVVSLSSLDRAYARSRQARSVTRSSSFPSQPWVAGSPLVPAFRQENAVDAPELPDASILGLSWHPFWIPCCCSSNAGEMKSTAARVAGPSIERVPRDALGKALVHLAFWKLRPHEFSIEWMQKQEADWRHQVTLSRGQLYGGDASAVEEPAVAGSKTPEDLDGAVTPDEADPNQVTDDEAPKEEKDGLERIL